MDRYSCSDCKDIAFKMIMKNFPDVQHFFGSMFSQNEGEDCKFHEGFCPPSSNNDVAVLGTPCQPFSRQRSKRSIEGTVRSHSKYETTFSDMLDFLKCHQPRCAVAEQVEGLTIPEFSGSVDRPVERTDGVLESLRIDFVG